MNYITQNVLSYCDIKTLEKFSNLNEEIKNLYKKNIKKGYYGSYFEISKQFFLLNDENKINNYSFPSIYYKTFVCFNSLFNENILIIYNFIKNCLDLFEIENNLKFKKNFFIKSKELKILKYYLNIKEKKEYVLYSDEYYNIIIFNYKKYNLDYINTILNENIKTKNLNYDFFYFNFKDENFILKFNYFSNKIELKNFDNIFINHASCNSNMKFINYFSIKNDSVNFFTFFNNGISTYEINKNKKLFSLKNFSSFNKSTNVVISFNEEFLLEGNKEFILIWNFFTGENINKIQINFSYENCINILQWNEEILFVCSDLGSIYKLNMKNNQKTKLNFFIENYFQIKKIFLISASLILLSSKGEIILLSE